MRSLEDWELVALAKQGNQEAFNSLVERYKSPVYTLCLYITRNVQNAEDLVQETFIRLYKNICYIEPQAQFKTFILGIARNLAFNQVRNEQRKKSFLSRFLEFWNYNHKDVNTSISTGWLPNEKNELSDMIQQCLMELKPEHREILILREMQGLDYESIARILGCRLGTVRSRLARARAELRNVITNKGIQIK